MPRLIRIRGKAQMEILGSVEPSSPNPRRNTSKSFFEASRSGDKTGDMSPLCCHFSSSPANNRRQNWRHVANSESAIPNNTKNYYAR
jgi:hypothetical protein